MSRILLSGLVLALAAGAARAEGQPVAKASPKPVDVVICLDVSNSMDGLIGSAKQKLWDIVNDLGRAQPTPDLRVALYSYGNDGYDPAVGWVRKEVDLTSDLDEIYRKLTGLTTRGGTEYVARVCRDSLKDQKWSTAADALKIVFVCGNEPASQDPQVKLADVATQAKLQGVIINPIFCGDSGAADAADWKQFAMMSGGRFASINQDRGGVAMATPFDKELGDLSGKINTTYLAYGKDGRDKALNQSAQDANAASLNSGVAAARAVVKGGDLYKTSDWDLVDRLKDDPKFDVTKLTVEELPEDMKKLKPEERVAYIQKKTQEREAIRKQIGDIAARRDAFIKEEQKRNPSAADKAFDAAIRDMLRDQAAPKGLKIPH
jgi:hypothetical protein